MHARRGPNPKVNPPSFSAAGPTVCWPDRLFARPSVQRTRRAGRIELRGFGVQQHKFGSTVTSTEQRLGDTAVHPKPQIFHGAEAQLTCGCARARALRGTAAR